MVTLRDEIILHGAVKLGTDLWVTTARGESARVNWGLRGLPAAYEVYQVEVGGTHRIVYQIKDESTWILVVMVADRKDVYRRISELKRSLR